MRFALAFVLGALVGCGGTIGDSAEEPTTEGPVVTETTDSGVPETIPEAVDTGTTDTDVNADTDMSADTAAPPDTTPAPVVDAGPSSTRHVARPLGSTDAPRGFYEYLPPGYSSTGGKSPLLLFFHGVGENGNGTTMLKDILVAGPPKLIQNDKWPNSRPFVVLSSQNASGCPTADGVKAFLDWSLAHYNIDPARIYITGLSCGAIGSWNYLRTYVSTTPVAAVVAIAGDGRGAWDTNKCGLGRVALWGFHGDADSTVDSSGTEVPMKNLIACAAPPRRDAKLTIYPGVGHDSWSRTYDLSAGHDLYAWLLENHR